MTSDKRVRMEDVFVALGVVAVHLRVSEKVDTATERVYVRCNRAVPKLAETNRWTLDMAKVTCKFCRSDEKALIEILK